MMTSGLQQFEGSKYAPQVDGRFNDFFVILFKSDFLIQNSTRNLVRFIGNK